MVRVLEKKFTESTLLLEKIDILVMVLQRNKNTMCCFFSALKIISGRDFDNLGKIGRSWKLFMVSSLYC